MDAWMDIWIDGWIDERIENDSMIHMLIGFTNPMSMWACSLDWIGLLKSNELLMFTN